MQKKLIAIILAGVFVLPLPFPNHTYAKTNIDQQISDLQKKIQHKEQKQQDVKKQLSLNEDKQKVVKQTLNQLEAELKSTKEKISHLNEDIRKAESTIEQLKKDLTETEARIKTRNALLNDRIRLLYEKGKLSYLEVLFRADSFRDFLVRFDAVRTISERDKYLLEQNRLDKERIEKNKVKIEQSLANLNELKEKVTIERQQLANKEKEYKLKLASLQEEHEHLDAVTEQEAEEVRQLIGQLVRAKAEKETQIREEERRRQEAERQQRAAEEKRQTAKAKGETKPSANQPNQRSTTPSQPSPSPATSEGFLWPVPGYGVSSPFGWRNGRMHNGIDIAGRGILGKPILAVASGEVIEARPASGYGNIVVIYHGNGISTLYAHMPYSSIKVRPGDKVSRGQVIANVGNEGRSTGPHLHFEVLKYNKPVNPMNFFR